MRTEKTACILCSRDCGLEVEIEDRRLTRIRGDAEHPLSKGYLCQKAARLDHYQNHDDRLRYPLPRQPDGSFVRVSWDEALGDIAQRLVQIRNRHGGEAFATAGGGYLAQIRAALKSRYSYNSLGQEKAGDLTWRALESEAMPGNAYPFILVAGERRTYNANQIYRNPAWRKVDPRGAMLCIRPMPHNWDLPMEAASYASRNTGISKPSSRSTTPCVASSPRSDGEVSMFGVVVTLFGHRAHR